MKLPATCPSPYRPDPAAPRRRPGRLLMPAVAGLLLGAGDLRAEGFTEPPAVVYGKVIHVDGGSRVQLFSGRLRVKFQNTADLSNAVTLETSLGPSGLGGIFSYALEVPQTYLPDPEELGETLRVGAGTTAYEISEITVDDVAAAPLDEGMAQLETSFANRGEEHRLDLAVTLDLADTDGDGIPDWWEQLHGLNPEFSGDAVADPDADGWDNLTEFARGTDPGASDTAPSITTSSLVVPAGGVAGFYVNLVDADSDPVDVALTLSADPPAGLVLAGPAGALGDGDGFTYADVLAGLYRLEVDDGFAGGSLELDFGDTESGPGAFAHTLFVTVFSPGDLGVDPVLWLDAADLVAGGVTDGAAVAEWADASGAGRNAYQPGAGGQPALSAGPPAEVVFDGDDLLYLDDGGLALDAFSAFAAFRADGAAVDEQVLLGGNDFVLRVAGPAAGGSYSGAVQLSEGGRLASVPGFGGSGGQVTLARTAAGDRTSLARSGSAPVPSAHSRDVLGPAFFTLGGSGPVGVIGGDRYLNGALSEFVLFDRAIDPASVARVEDYQLSRWSGHLVWDLRNETAPVELNGGVAHRNHLNGGWGDDTITGGPLGDVLRGGPGNDGLSGGGGADRFQFFPSCGHDRIADFDPAGGDVIDLGALLGGASGPPADFVSLEITTRRGDDGLPGIATVLAVDRGGDGGEPDLTVVLEGVAYTPEDLTWLAGEGHLVLGGPAYESALGFTVPGTDEAWTELEVPRALVLTRGGNLGAALEVELVFGGTADVDVDFSLGGVSGSGAVRTVSFPRGAASATVWITPVQDTFDEDETIEVALRPHPRLTATPPAPLTFALADAPGVEVSTVVPYAQRNGAIPGVIAVHRSGDATGPLEVSLAITGTADNGRDIELISSLLTFGEGEATKHIEVTPVAGAPSNGVPDVVQISVLPDPRRFALLNPWTATVLVVDGVDPEVGLTNFDAWRAVHFPGDESSNLAAGNPDFDAAANLLEYGYGTDPNTPQLFQPAGYGIFNTDGFFEVRFISQAGLTDLRFRLEQSTTGASWADASESFDLLMEPMKDGRIPRAFRSKISANAFGGTRLYRVAMALVEPPRTTADAAEAAGANGRSFLARGDAGWIPSTGADTLVSPPLEAGDESVLTTFAEGPFDLTFDWMVDSPGGGDSVSVLVDGTPVATRNGAFAWETVNHAEAATGTHEIRWVFTGAGGNAALRGVDVQ